MANSIRRFYRLDGRNDRGKAGPHRDIGGSPYAEPARPAMRARASPERSHLRTWPACSWLVPSLSFRCRRPRSPACHARCRACVDATDANSAAHSPGNSGRGPAVYDDDDISHPALASAISPSRPGPTSLRLASSASNQVAPLFFSECSGSTTSEAGPTGGPACPAMPPTPHPLGSIS